MNQNYQWVDFYTELASALWPYKSKRAKLLEILKEIFQDAGMKYPFREKGEYDYEDIDPFTIFASFNKTIKEVSRIALLEGFAKHFLIKAPVPKSFQGIPVVMNLNAWFFAYKGGRGEDDVDNLWALFETAIAYADERPSDHKAHFIHLFDIVKEQKMIRWNITMGLYWIRPFTFINLDSVNRAFMKARKDVTDAFADIFTDLDKGVPDGESYLSMCKRAKDVLNQDGSTHRNFPELSADAWEKNKKDKKTGGSELEADVKEMNYWTYSPGKKASKWEEFYDLGIMGIGWDEVSDLKMFHSKEDMKDGLRKAHGSELSYKNDAHCLWQFANEIQVGDIIFAKRGLHTIVGRGVVTSDYIYDPKRASYKHIRKVNWQKKGEWECSEQASLKTLTCVTPYPEFVQALLEVFDEDTEEEMTRPREIKYPPYTKDDFLNEVFMDERKYNTLIDLLEAKFNVILQGAPGVGKTFVAKRLAYSIMGEKDISRVTMVQFHQSYSYEDFIQGYRPSENGFELAKGAFYKFCKEAEEDDERSYFFIIDEINRGNLSKILGELMMLIEKDKRGERIKMLYSNEQFTVPKNVRIIGMMNTADRSLAFMDYALRRRFAFFDIAPAFDSDGFRAYLEDKNDPKLNHLIDAVGSLNREIASDESLGEGFQIGHSYFCTKDEITEEWLHAVIEYEVIPLIKEYWFDEPGKVRDRANILRDAIK